MNIFRARLIKFILISALLNVSPLLMAMEKFSDVFEETLICANENGVGEPIYISGTFRSQAQYVENAKHSTWVWQVFWRGDGIGLTTGSEYIVRGKWMEVMQDAPPYIFIWNDHFQLIGKGKAENYDTHFKIKIIVNANGEPIVDYIDFYECDSF